MRVELKDLKPNPYRDLKKYPIKQERVDALKASIEQTGFWDNVLARIKAGSTLTGWNQDGGVVGTFNDHFEIVEINEGGIPVDYTLDKGSFELAYGHNRLVALQQLGIEEIDIPVKDISDADMVRIMATENREQYDENQAILIETVQTVKDFLSSEISKYELFEEISPLILNLVSVDKDGNHLAEKDQKKSFSSLKNQGIGQHTIYRFLGKGWKRWKIEHALEVLNSSEINPEAIKKFNTTGMGVAFTKAIKEINKESNETLSFSEQEKLADKFFDRKVELKEIGGKTGGGNYYSAIKDIVKAEYIGSKYRKPTAKKSVHRKEQILKYESHVAEIRNESDNLRHRIRDLTIAEKELGQIAENVQRKLLEMSLNSLIRQIELLTSNTNKNEKVKQNTKDLKCVTE